MHIYIYIYMEGVYAGVSLYILCPAVLDDGEGDLQPASVSPGGDRHLATAGGRNPS